MADRPIVVITGANGFIGRHLVAGFDDRGWAVRALVHRMPVSPRPGVEYTVWELRQSAGEALAGAERLIHAASADYTDPGARQINVDGSERIVAEAREAEVKSLTFLSSMSARERAPSRYGEDKHRIARLFDAHDDLVIRPGLVLGDGGLFGRLREFVAGHRFVPLVGGGHQRFQTVYVGDLVAALLAAASKHITGTITVAERQPVEFRTLLAELARLIGAHPRFVPVPEAPVAVVLCLAGMAGVRLPVSSDNLAGLRGLETYPVEDDLRRLGIDVRDYRASLQSILQGG